MWSLSKEAKVGLFVVGVFIVFVAFWATVGYVAYHFVAKFW